MIIATALSIDAWTYAAFIGAAMVLMATPGPNMMFSIACGLSGGPKAGIAAGCGAGLGMLVHTGLVALGVASVLMASPAAYEALRIGGALYLVYLAWSSWRAGDDLERRLGRRQVGRALWRGFVINLTNPKVILFMIALLPQFADPAIGPVWRQIVVFGMLQAMIAVVFDGLCGGLAGRLAARLRHASRMMNRISALIFGGLAARILAA